MQTIFLFDVDGTLTPARQKIVQSFEVYFRKFVSENSVYLISGSDYKKLQEQVPQDIMDACQGIYGSSGAQFYQNGEEVSCKKHEFSAEIRALCEGFIRDSAYQIRTGTHIEERPSMLNISSVGRQASMEERKAYYLWDKEKGERARFADGLNKNFTDYEASAGGEISIDIVPTGWNKSVAKKAVLEMHPDAQLIFFGDKMGAGGNDKPLADALSIKGEAHRAISVNNYEDTWRQIERILKSLKDDKSSKVA